MKAKIDMTFESVKKGVYAASGRAAFDGSTMDKFVIVSMVMDALKLNKMERLAFVSELAFGDLKPADGSYSITLDTKNMKDKESEEK